MTHEQFLELYRRYSQTNVVSRYALVGHLLRTAWCKETASPSTQASWSKENPALGQCAVTALIVNDLFGGAFLRCVVEGFGSHYANSIPIGESFFTLDYTSGQFPNGTSIPNMDPVPRERLLEGPAAIAARTPERYALLRERVAAVMQDALDPDSAG